MKEGKGQTNHNLFDVLATSFRKSIIPNAVIILKCNDEIHITKLSCRHLYFCA